MLRRRNTRLLEYAPRRTARCIRLDQLIVTGDRLRENKPGTGNGSGEILGEAYLAALGRARRAQDANRERAVIVEIARYTGKLIEPEVSSHARPKVTQDDDVATNAAWGWLRRRYEAVDQWGFSQGLW